VFYISQLSAEYRIQDKLNDVKSDDEGLVTVKIPIHLPYQTNWKEFERIDGELKYNGTTYKYVKRKVQNDTLILVCLNFNQKDLIQKNSNDYFKKVNDISTDANKKPVLKQAKVDDYCRLTNVLLIRLFTSNQKQPVVWKRCISQPGFASQIFMPPDNKI
jgi:hypothetical protein